MIKCPNCGGLNTEGSQVCGACATPLVNSSSVNNVNGQVQIIRDDVLIDAYMGENARSLKSGFSWCTLFFEWIYFWYRKMYGLLAIWFVAVLGINGVQAVLRVIVLSKSSDLKEMISNANTFNLIFGILNFIVLLAFSIKFKDLYFKHVLQKVMTIKSQNPNKTEKELAEICRKKGGTNPIPVFLVLGFILISVAFTMLTNFDIVSKITGVISSGEKGISSIKGSNGAIGIGSIDKTNKALNASKRGAFYDAAYLAIETVKVDLVTNGYNGDTIVYNKDKLNSLLEKKLTNSSYDNPYIYAQVMVTKDVTSGRPSYKVCLIDSGHNGFGYTEERNLSSKIVLVGNAPDHC